MPLILYGDFNCPYSCLASQRMDTLVRLGRAELEWRAVEQDPRLALTGTPSAARSGEWDRQLADVTRLALPGEQPPAAVPPLISNTAAAVAAYAEAVADGVAGDLRRRLFREIWVDQRHLSSAYEVRTLVRAAMYPGEPVAAHLAIPDLPSRANRAPDPRRLARLSGCTIATDGGPLTTAGYQRMWQWRREWREGPGVVPALILPDGAALAGTAVLTHLATLVPEAGHQPDPAQR